MKMSPSFSNRLPGIEVMNEDEEENQNLTNEMDKHSGNNDDDAEVVGDDGAEIDDNQSIATYTSVKRAQPSNSQKDDAEVDFNQVEGPQHLEL